MSKTKHTPGPWVVKSARSGFYVESQFDVIVDSLDESGRYGAIDDEANARLIAAAPELLEALEKLYALVEGESPSLLDEDSGGDSRLDIEICAAIAKAKGEGV